MRVLRGFLLFLCLSSVAEAQWWSVQTSGIDTNLRAVSAAWWHDAKGAETAVVWASGSNGVILRSLDEGKTWKRIHVAGGESLDFRGIAAFDGNVAYVMSIGNGDKSRIYKTNDGGETWTLQYTGPRKETFLDAISCDSKNTCVVLGDPIDGKFLLLSTEDGEHWKELARDKMPPALPNEGAFAASNSSLCVDDNHIYFGTGGAAKARVFHSADSGKTWTAEDTPIASGNASSGIFSLSCMGRILYAVGGDYNDPSRVFHSAAYFHTSGYPTPGYPPSGAGSWRLSKEQPGGFRSGVASAHGDMALAVGPNGEDMSHDFGVTWDHTDSINLNAVTMLDIFDGWAVGSKGTVARFLNQTQYDIRKILPNPPATKLVCCLLDWGWLSTLPRPSQSDSAPSLPEGEASPSPTEIGGSVTGRQHAVHSN